MEQVIELAVRIEGAGEGRVQASVIESEYGPTSPVPITSPLESGEIVSTLATLGYKVIPPGDPGHDQVLIAEDVDPADACTQRGWEDLGKALHDYLFTGPAQAKLLLSLGACDGKIAGDDRTALRLRLVFGAPASQPNRTDLSRGELNLIAALPWEFLFEPHSCRFLSRSEHLTLVRSLEVPRRSEPIVLRSLLRVLLVAAQAKELTHLNLEEEKARVRHTLAAHEIMEVEETEGGTFEELQSRLREREYHVVHFLGHGKLHNQHGSLVFTDAEGNADRVPAQRLARLFAEHRSLRLVVLNACRTGQSPREFGADPFLSVGAALIEQGVPAVVAMQFPINDKAAIEFSSTLYASLVAGRTVDSAVSQWRSSAFDRFADWVTPVVFLAGRSGQLIDPGGVLEKAASDGRHSETPSKETLRLGIRSIVQESDGHPPAWARNMERESDRILSLASAFDGRYIRSPHLWKTSVLPNLMHFLAESVSTGRPLFLDMAAHMSIAFAAGYYLEAKAGLKVDLRQRGVRGTEDWHVDEGVVPEAPLWSWGEPVAIGQGGSDLAVAISISRDIGGQVQTYLGSAGCPVRELIPVAIHPKPGQVEVQGGAHALALATELVDKIAAHLDHHPAARVHLFYSGPNALYFYLGRLARTLGSIQLYEHDFEGKRHGSYEPSIELPPGDWRARDAGSGALVTGG